MSLKDRLRAAPKQLAKYAGTIKAEFGEAATRQWKSWREAARPGKPEPNTATGRPFGREGGEDVKHVVWSGHVKADGQQSFYGAVGLTRNGEYRAASVQVYGGGVESWRWNSERHIDKSVAISKAAENPAKKYGGTHNEKSQSLSQEARKRSR